MSFFQKIKGRLLGRAKPERVAVDAAAGYDLWSLTYDKEPWNLMVALDEQLFSALLHPLSLKDNVIVDVGCGTGRHWDRLLQQSPRSLTGFDVSAGMLARLRQKHTGADARLMQDDQLTDVADQSVDLVVSTLALAHFKAVEGMLAEWARVLKPGAHMIITDAHPVSFEQGADITFGQGSKTYEVAHYIYPLEKIRAIASANGLEETGFEERVVDASVKHFYESQHAMATYRKFEGVPLIYGIRFRKSI